MLPAGPVHYRRLHEHRQRRQPGKDGEAPVVEIHTLLNGKGGVPIIAALSVRLAGAPALPLLDRSALFPRRPENFVSYAFWAGHVLPTRTL